MLRYIVEKNGGSVKYSEKSFLGFGSWEQKISATINGATKEYSIGKNDFALYITNGVSVIDSDVLEDDFGLSQTQATHQVGDSFKSVDHAAMAWGFKYNSLSINDNLEYASAVYADGGNFKFTNPLIGDNDSVSVPTPPNGKNLAAIIHSHGAYDARYNNENFSGKTGDKGIADTLKSLLYLTTPGGYLKLYNSLNSKTSTISKKMPSDPNYP
ncbi:DUF4329 domain-containing protein [Paenibacillus sp. FJAT-26967]|uniref:DUF4329 domain-containing protein n=1 Tax=Paenibacillus sp. FJAT-26967 TaxID=1729690 RepID=UPI000837D23C|nr:DUF4329 domain-containing protein [Paenibacillus sp. FJAT-26967]